MALVTELELPELDYLAEDLKGERFHEAMNALRARGWLTHSPIGYCLGANLARAELQEALAFLPARMPGLELDGVAELGSIHGIYGLERLPLRWK